MLIEKRHFAVSWSRTNKWATTK